MDMFLDALAVTILAVLGIGLLVVVPCIVFVKLLEDWRGALIMPAVWGFILVMTWASERVGW